jgi:hypothetical protein
MILQILDKVVRWLYFLDVNVDDMRIVIWYIELVLIGFVTWVLSLFFIGLFIPSVGILPSSQSLHTWTISWTDDERTVLSHTGDTHHLVRMTLIRTLIDQWFSRFQTQPYQTGNGLIVLNLSQTWYIVTQTISWTDSLDMLIESVISHYKPSWWLERIFGYPWWIHFDAQQLARLDNVQLFKRQQDLIDLWYELVSRRMRVSTDAWVRRYNIKKSFDNMGWVRVLNSSGSLSFFDVIDFDPREQRHFQIWKGIIGTDVVMMYAGWICWASTALMQGVLTNAWIQFDQRRNHSKWYTHLYRATIDGKSIATPWLDSTVYDGSIDLKLSNRRSYPIIIVANFDGKLRGIEEVFTLGKSPDRGSISYVSRIGNCYTRLRNDIETLKSCYQEINP